jgi:uncharacterized protein YifN (PemK superfamily)
MATITPKFVKHSQVFMCLFEACWDIANSKVANGAGYKANISPEIGKMRPVVIVHAHKRNRLAIVVPFTTQKPLKEITKTLYIPTGNMPGVLGKNECWALCDMVQTVSIARLQNVYAGQRNIHLNPQDSVLPKHYFEAIKTILKNLF